MFPPWNLCCTYFSGRSLLVRLYLWRI
jgi:hypothetical protein